MHGLPVFFEQISRYAICALGVLILIICIISLLKRKSIYTEKAFLTSTSSGEKTSLKDFETSIGRSKACDIVLDHGTVSRFHAVISMRKKTWYLTDTFSKTGTFINMKKIKHRAPIKDGDVISFGTAAYRFETPFISDEEPGEQNPRMRSVQKEKAQAQPVYVSALLDDSKDMAYCLNVSDCKIGRDPEQCDIVLKNPTVSRLHARLYHNSRGWMLEDLNSTAGTKVNGEHITGKTKLSEGDEINIGGVKLKFCLRFKRVK